MNNWYNRVSTAPAIQNSAQTQQRTPSFQNPVQKAAFIMQALTNPAAFVKQQFPDVPDGILNDPVQVRNYIQQSRGISDQQLMQYLNQYPMPRF